jgi:hypothetical protein
MPSQINLQITGRIGNVVFYKRGDKYYARSVPGRIRQTKGMKKRATVSNALVQIWKPAPERYSCLKRFIKQ